MSADASFWLAGKRVRAVGADNMAWDEIRHGIYIIENLFLKELAQDRSYEFTFVCLPLKMRGATGSPVRPIAMVSRG